MPTATAPQKAATVVQPFAIEADVPQNGDLLFQCIHNCRLRSKLSHSRTIKDKKGRDIIPKDPARHLGMLPQVPGMQLHVNPAKLSYTITDPLHDDEEMCETIRLALLADGRPMRPDKIVGDPPQDGTLDKHFMKTLIREMVRFVDAKHAVAVRGSMLPKPEAIDRLPGHYLLNPGSVEGNLQPRFEKDWDAYVERLAVAGG